MPQVRLIDASSKQVGIVPIKEALDLAQQHDLDLVEISPNVKPPVVKVMDWGKYRYEQEKQQQKNKKKQKNIEVKQIRLGLKIDSHDLDTKLKAANKFLSQGYKVKVNLRFRGREITHPELGKQILDNYYKKIEDIAQIEGEATMSGRELSILLIGRKNAKAKN